MIFSITFSVVEANVPRSFPLQPDIVHSMDLSEETHRLDCSFEKTLLSILLLKSCPSSKPLRIFGDSRSQSFATADYLDDALRLCFLRKGHHSL
jgi:hypothetical protein